MPAVCVNAGRAPRQRAGRVYVLGQLHGDRQLVVLRDLEDQKVVARLALTNRRVERNLLTRRAHTPSCSSTCQKAVAFQLVSLFLEHGSRPTHHKAVGVLLFLGQQVQALDVLKLDLVVVRL